VLDSMDRWLVRTLDGAMELDRWVIAHLTDVLNDHVLPAVARSVERGRRLFAPPRR
jgi:hypothetical protein